MDWDGEKVYALTSAPEGDPGSQFKSQYKEELEGMKLDGGE